MHRQTDVTMIPLSVVVCSALLATFAAATNVEQCPGRSFDDLADRVQLTPCKRAPCRLKKGTSQHISIRFTPESEIADIRNRVSAEVFGVPVPFIGVDGKSVCEKLETEGGEKAPCPVKAGVTYVYKDTFPILNIYPSISVKVHWALLDGDKDLVCFEVPAQIK